MSTTKTTTTGQASNALATIDQKIKKLDEAAAHYAMAVQEESPFSSALALADGIQAIRGLLDDEVMGRLLLLSNSPLGFLTDKDPSRPVWNDQQKRMVTPEPYTPDQIRDTIIESVLRGYRVVGNEFNIIAARFYAAKNGLFRKVTTYPGVTDFKETFSVPVLKGDNGAIVTGKADWIKEGVKQSLERQFAIRVNKAMGVDAIIGKAQRKLYAAVLNQLSGIVTPEGEVDDSIPIQGQVVQEAKQPTFQEPTIKYKNDSSENQKPADGPGRPEHANPVDELDARLEENGISQDTFFDWVKASYENDGRLTAGEIQKILSDKAWAKTLEDIKAFAAAGQGGVK